MAQADNLRRIKTGVAVFAVLAVAVCAFWLVKAVIIFTTPESDWVAPLPVLGGAGTAQVASVRNLDAALDPFHRGETGEPVQVAIGEDAPETTLNLVLKGQRFGPNPSATIQTPDRREAVYYLNDELLNGVTLEAVNPDYVVIRRNGILERLSIDRESVLQTPEAQRAQSVPINRPGSARPSRPAVTATAATENVTAELLRNATLSRAERDGEFAGYEIGTRSNAGSAILNKLGLNEGDIITTVNGQKLAENGSDIASLMSELQRRPSTSLLVLRGDNVITVRLGR